MADMPTRVFETDPEFEAYWTSPERATLVGNLDWVDAKKAFTDGRADLLVPSGDRWLAYRVTTGVEADRLEAQEFTKRVRQGLLARSFA